MVQLPWTAYHGGNVRMLNVLSTKTSSSTPLCHHPPHQHWPHIQLVWAPRCPEHAAYPTHRLGWGGLRLMVNMELSAGIGKFSVCPHTYAGRLVCARCPSDHLKSSAHLTLTVTWGGPVFLSAFHSGGNPAWSSEVFCHIPQGARLSGFEPSRIAIESVLLVFIVIVILIVIGTGLLEQKEILRSQDMKCILLWHGSASINHSKQKFKKET